MRDKYGGTSQARGGKLCAQSVGVKTSDIEGAETQIYHNNNLGFPDLSTIVTITASRIV